LENAIDLLIEHTQMNLIGVRRLHANLELCLKMLHRKRRVSFTEPEKSPNRSGRTPRATTGLGPFIGSFPVDFVSLAVAAPRT